MTKTLKKTLPILLSLLGVALFTFIAARAGIQPVVEALGKVGIGGFILLVIFQLIVDLGLGVAWKGAVPQLGLRRLTSARLVRDAAGACLPFSQLGGIVIGVRATLSGKDPRSLNGEELHWPEGVAANLVDITTEVLGQIAFVLLALACLAGHQGAARFIWPLMGGMAVLAIGIAGFIWTQHRGGPMVKKAAQFFGRHIASEWRDALIDNTDAFQASLEALWSRPDRIMRGAFSHFCCWLAGGFMTWCALHMLGAKADLLSAIAIEGVVCGIMSAGFLVPGALGVQEAAYVALGMIFGIDSEISLSLSLLRRGRDLLIGIPVLLFWQIVEMRRLRLAGKGKPEISVGPLPKSVKGELPRVQPKDKPIFSTSTSRAS
ncbi:flippase-like domain-containing protein [Gluconobacter wancherniae]|uniref:lysylphosphatidylglycerol synthase domain-containing protein n=1 Tax=Gluconobacter wancherniae TaxID=1307955 RepID=UPI001B8CE363|nr:flippase-like domain-containing protein [Gluconobacter wancherniae]